MKPVTETGIEEWNPFWNVPIERAKARIEIKRQLLAKLEEALKDTPAEATGKALRQTLVIRAGPLTIRLKPDRDNLLAIIRRAGRLPEEKIRPTTRKASRASQENTYSFASKAEFIYGSVQRAYTKLKWQSENAAALGLDEPTVRMLHSVLSILFNSLPEQQKKAA